LQHKTDNCKDCRLFVFCKFVKCSIRLFSVITVTGRIHLNIRPCCDCVQHCEAVKRIEAH
jgi:hypothetical protein